jgi:EmrB/QacA subfamily drug resistance transporter
MTKTQQRGTLAVVCLATAMLMLDIAVVNTALGHIADDLGAGLSGLQWVVDAYTVALASVVLTAGSVSDRLGRRRLFAVGMVLFTAASLACALAGNIGVLDGARAVQGLGGAILFAGSLAILADAFPDMKERAGALAIYGATIGASFAIGPLVGGALTSGFGWRAVFFINVPLGILAIAGIRAWVRESRDPDARGLDWPGQVTLSGGLFLLVFALLRGNDEGWSSALISGSLAASAILLAAFVIVQRRVREPMLPLGLFRNRSFTAAQAAVFGISASFFAIFLYTTLYLQEILGLSPIQAGLVYLPGTVIMFFVSGASAQLGERIAPVKLLGGGLLLVAAGMAFMLTVGTDSSWLALEPGMVLASIGTGILNPSISGLALSSVPPQMSGLAAGVNDTFRQAGIAVGVAAFGAMVPAGAALGDGSASSYVDGLHTAMLVGAAVALAGAAASVWLLGGRRAATPAPVPEAA